MVTTVNITAPYTWKLLRESNLSVLTTHKNIVIMYGDGSVN